MWHQRLMYLNHQDLRRLLESSGKRITDSDVEPVMEPMDINPVMDIGDRRHRV